MMGPRGLRGMMGRLGAMPVAIGAGAAHPQELAPMALRAIPARTAMRGKQEDQLLRIPTDMLK